MSKLKNLDETQRYRIESYRKTIQGILNSAEIMFDSLCEDYEIENEKETSRFYDYIMNTDIDESKHAVKYIEQIKINLFGKAD